MKRGERKRLRQAGICLILAWVLGVHSAGAALSEAMPITALQTLAEADEPSPYEGPSLQETSPFDPIPLDPAVLMEEISKAQSPEDVQKYLKGYGVPLAPSDGEYVYSNKSRVTCQRLSLRGDEQALSGVTIVSYAYSAEDNDNFAFLFCEQDGVDTLIDGLSGFGNVQVMQDASNGNAWLVGSIGKAHQTIRWYHLQSRSIVFSYLAQGIMADRADFHLKVTAQLHPLMAQTIPSDGIFSVRKQVSAMDLTADSAASGQAPETVLYTQVDVYEVQPDGTLRALASKRYAGMDLLAVAGIENEQVVAER